MKIVIDEEVISRSKYSFEEFLNLLIIHAGFNPGNLNSELIAKQYIISDNNKFYLSNVVKSDIVNLLIDSECNIDVSDIKELANQMRLLFPEGLKVGSTSWRMSVGDAVTRLKQFKKIYGNYSNEDILKATKRYVEFFKNEGSNKYMKCMRYFIYHNKTVENEDGSGSRERQSLLAEWIDNGEELGKLSVKQYVGDIYAL